MASTRKRGIAFIPARAGSLRVKSKNTRILRGHPLIAYTIQAARASGIFAKVLVTTDSEETQAIARHYGADAPFLRPQELATSTAIDIQWIKHAFSQLPGETYEFFSILRPTSPFRTVAMIRRAYEQFNSRDDIDSIRAVNLCHEHPGKMWTLDEAQGIMRPFMGQGEMDVPWHARQYQDLPKVYIQNSSLEMGWTRVVWDTNSREGRILAPFLTNETEGFAIDYEREWLLAEMLVERGLAELIPIEQAPFGLHARSGASAEPQTPAQGQS